MAIAAIVADDPDMPPYQVTRGLVASALGDWPAAADAFDRAATTDDLPQSWLGLAQARLELGAPAADVVEAIERAMRVGYQQAAVVYAAGSLYDRLGLTDEATMPMSHPLAALPGLAVDPCWRQERSQPVSTGSWPRPSRSSAPAAGRSRCTRASSTAHASSPSPAAIPSERASSSTPGTGTRTPSDRSSTWPERLAGSDAARLGGTGRRSRG